MTEAEEKTRNLLKFRRAGKTFIKIIDEECARGKICRQKLKGVAGGGRSPVSEQRLHGMWGQPLRTSYGRLAVLKKRKGHRGELLCNLGYNVPKDVIRCWNCLRVTRVW